MQHKQELIYMLVKQGSFTRDIATSMSRSRYLTFIGLLQGASCAALMYVYVVVLCSL